MNEIIFVVEEAPEGGAVGPVAGRVDLYPGRERREIA